MSRRASLYAKEHPTSPRAKGVRFPDELVFLDSIKENDITQANYMLRRASITIDINGIADSGMTPLHQAALDDNLAAVQLLVSNGADINKMDEDTWTPLHAACAEGNSEIVRYLLLHGADKEIVTEEGERPIDLVDSQDFQTIAIMLSPNLSDNGHQEEEEYTEDFSDNGHQEEEEDTENLSDNGHHEEEEDTESQQ